MLHREVALQFFFKTNIWKNNWQKLRPHIFESVVCTEAVLPCTIFLHGSYGTSTMEKVLYLWSATTLYGTTLYMYVVLSVSLGPTYLNLQFVQKLSCHVLSSSMVVMLLPPWRKSFIYGLLLHSMVQHCTCMWF